MRALNQSINKLSGSNLLEDLYQSHSRAVTESNPLALNSLLILILKEARKLNMERALLEAMLLTVVEKYLTSSIRMKMKIAAGKVDKIKAIT